jgi:hypothetical protein
VTAVDATGLPAILPELAGALVLTAGVWATGDVAADADGDDEAEGLKLGFSDVDRRPEGEGAPVPVFIGVVGGVGFTPLCWALMALDHSATTFSLTASKVQDLPLRRITAQVVGWMGECAWIEMNRERNSRSRQTPLNGDGLWSDTAQLQAACVA